MGEEVAAVRKQINEDGFVGGIVQNLVEAGNHKGRTNAVLFVDVKVAAACRAGEPQSTTSAFECILNVLHP